jgi:hypothetical protein
LTPPALVLESRGGAFEPAVVKMSTEMMESVFLRKYSRRAVKAAPRTSQARTQTKTTTSTKTSHGAREERELARLVPLPPS